MCGICVADQIVTSPVGTGLGQHAARLHRVGYQAWLDEAARHHDVRGVDRGLDTVRLELPDVALVRTEILVHERRIVSKRPLDVRDGRKWFIVHVDELGGVLRERAALRDDDRHPVTLVAGLVGREWEVRRHLDVFGDRPCTRHAARPVVREVGAGECSNDAFCAACGIEAHALDARSRIGAAHDGHVDRAGQGQVVDERPTAAEE